MAEGLGNFCGSQIPQCNLGSLCFPQEDPPPPCKIAPETGKGPCYPGPNPKPCSASPCTAQGGVYFFSETDLNIPTNGFPLTAYRLYRSSHLVDGPMGYGWVSGLTSRVFYAAYAIGAGNVYSKEADVVMPNGETYRYVDMGSGAFSNPPARFDTFVKNADGTFDLTPQHTRSKYHYDATTGALLTMTDDYGNALSFTYDGSGRLQRVADTAGSGRYLDVFWGPDGRMSDLRDHTGRLVHYTYDARGVMTGVTDPLSRTTSYSYVTGKYAPLMSQIKDPWGRVITDITWNPDNRMATRSEQGETYAYALQPDASVLRTDLAGNRAWYLFGNYGLITRRIPQNYQSNERISDYYTTSDGCLDGLLKRSTDESVVITDYTYNCRGNVLTNTRDTGGPQEIRFDYTYDTTFPDKVTSVTPKKPLTGLRDPDWQGWKYDYYSLSDSAPGALFHVNRVRDDGTNYDTLATYVYDAKGRVTETRDGMGVATNYTYDSAGNLQAVTGPANNDAGTRPVTTYGYDALGRVTSVTDPLNHVTTYTYDAADRILTVTLPKPTVASPLNFVTTYTYDHFDAASQLLTADVTDPNGALTRQQYDQFGRLVKSVDAQSHATTYGYTRRLLTSITDANNNQTRYDYDVYDRLLTTTFPDNSYEQYWYYADGLLHTKYRPESGSEAFNYDRLKRLTSKTSATYVNYTYTGQKLTSVDDQYISPGELHTYTYDSSYRLQSVKDGARGTITYSHNPNDTLASYGVQGGAAAYYSYYPDGSLNTIGWSPVLGNFKYAYTMNGQYQTVTFPNGQTRSYSYDDRGRLVQLANVHPSAGNLATYGYEYDVDHATGAQTMLDQRTAMTATVPSQSLNNALTQYYYDSLYQLSRANYPNVAPLNGETHSWTYDDIGNRTTNTVNGSTTAYTYQKIGTNPLNWQRLLSDGVNSYGYNSLGDTASRNGPGGVTGFGWNPPNHQLTSITGPITATYQYDYAGKRVTKNAGTQKNYLYDGMNLVQEAGGQTLSYLYGPGIDEPLAIARSGEVDYYVTDALGSVTLLNDAGGAVKNGYVYDAWGVSRSETENFSQPFRYTARESGEAGTLFYRARYLSPSTGRFLSEDPLRYGASRHFYSYVNGNPMLYTDPLGLVPWQSYLPNPWGCQLLTKKCYEEASCCAKKFDYNKVGEDDEATAIVSNVGTSDPVWTECVNKSDACRAMLMKCKSVMNPFNRPGTKKLKQLFEELWKWVGGNG
ncbi:MAG TPA: RHS repeat-associated core domain-containing protein [Thermoanaerobaculia bacterium]|nr:RHS repeat-associated core domain-containing protein [Thermoanaerobaculia bacterium]